MSDMPPIRCTQPGCGKPLKRMEGAVTASIPPKVILRCEDGHTEYMTVRDYRIRTEPLRE